ncbi:hypothetical protein GCM10018773_37350 [Streptomyces candidus]|nr:hypothetical protein GCM10018773_37350 [Streptomyces candidus]
MYGLGRRTGARVRGTGRAREAAGTVGVRQASYGCGDRASAGGGGLGGRARQEAVRPRGRADGDVRDGAGGGACEPSGRPTGARRRPGTGDHGRHGGLGVIFVMGEGAAAARPGAAYAWPEAAKRTGI